jgi:hypothetical protein
MTLARYWGAREMKLKVSIAAVLALAAATTPAFAYLDPGTGSMLLQGLIGGVAAASVVLSVYLQKIKETYARWFKRDQPR